MKVFDCAKFMPLNANALISSRSQLACLTAQTLHLPFSRHIETAPAFGLQMIKNSQTSRMQTKNGQKKRGKTKYTFFPSNKSENYLTKQQHFNGQTRKYSLPSWRVPRFGNCAGLNAKFQWPSQLKLLWNIV